MKRLPARKGKESPEAVTSCYYCATSLGKRAKALFVEEDVGRIFCSEACIVGHFGPDIGRLEREYFKRLSPHDLNAGEREKLAYLRWDTLRGPDEVWREKTIKGDQRYTLISQFKIKGHKIWCVCVCLFLRGEPSFLYIAFPTRNAEMANCYRRGEEMDWPIEDAAKSQDEAPLVDGLAADGWSDEETLWAQLRGQRGPDDIPESEFSTYQSCLEPTLDGPDEVWSLATDGDDPVRLYHFIRYYADEISGRWHWYVIVAKETNEEDELEIVDAFPTRDLNLVDRYRRGEQEVGHTHVRQSALVMH